MDFSLLGALYFDKIARKFKNFIQYLCEKPITTSSVVELIEIAQILSCENIEELENMMNEKNSMIVNKVISVDDVKEILLQRVDLDRTTLIALLKNYA